MSSNKIDWSASEFFEKLCRANRFANENGFDFAEVSSLEGFSDLLSDNLLSTAFVAVSDTSDGAITIEATPRTRRIKTVFMAMRHSILSGREDCLEIMRELFRQFMSVLCLERFAVSDSGVIIDPRVTFHEIDKYFASGCACAYFQIAVDVHTDLVFNDSEWDGLVI